SAIGEDRDRGVVGRDRHEVGARVAEADELAVDDVTPHLGAQSPRVEPARLDPGRHEHVRDRVAGEQVEHLVHVAVVKDADRGRGAHLRSQETATTGSPDASPAASISSAMRMACSTRVSTISASGTVFTTSPLTKICPLPLPDATPRSASRASPGPFTTQPMTATRSGTVSPSSPACTFSARV